LSQKKPCAQSLFRVQVEGMQVPRAGSHIMPVGQVPPSPPHVCEGMHWPVRSSQNCPAGQFASEVHWLWPGGTQVDRESQMYPFWQSLLEVQYPVSMQVPPGPQ